MSATKTKTAEDAEQLEAPSIAEDAVAEAARNLDQAEKDLAKAQREAAQPKGPTGYDMASEIAAADGRAFQPIDQRTGLAVGPATLTAAQRQEQIRIAEAAAAQELDEFMDLIRIAVGEPAPYGASDGAYDQRQANHLLRSALERLAAQQEDAEKAGLAQHALHRLDHNTIARAGGVNVW